MNHPIENRYRYGLVYDLNGQIVGFNLSPDVFVGLTDEEIESALEAYVKRKYELNALQTEPCENCISFPKGTLKKRDKGYVVYDVEWLKKHWQTELKIMGIESEDA